MAANSKKNIGGDGGRFVIFEWVISLKERYGILNILTSGLLMVFMSIMVTITLNPGIIFDKYSTYAEERHAQSFEYRMKSSKAVQLMLHDIRDDFSAMRVFVIELHNGKSNPTGLSFNFGSLTYEVLSHDATSVREDYSDFSLERYPFIMQLYEDGYWEGYTSDLKKIDKRLALKLESNDVYYVAFTSIYGMNREIGFLGITFSEQEYKQIPNLSNKLRKYATQLSPFLDGEKAK